MVGSFCCRVSSGFAFSLRFSETGPRPDEGDGSASCPFPHGTFHKGLGTKPMRLLWLGITVFQWIALRSLWQFVEERHTA